MKIKLTILSIIIGLSCVTTLTSYSYPLKINFLNNLPADMKYKYEFFYVRVTDDQNCITGNMETQASAGPGYNLTYQMDATDYYHWGANCPEQPSYVLFEITSPSSLFKTNPQYVRCEAKNRDMNCVSSGDSNIVIEKISPTESSMSLQMMP